LGGGGGGVGGAWALMPTLGFGNNEEGAAKKTGTSLFALVWTILKKIPPGWIKREELGV